jgi:hypothetical protein
MPPAKNSESPLIRIHSAPLLGVKIQLKCIVNRLYCSRFNVSLDLPTLSGF